MNRAWVAANPSKPPFKAASGWRPHRWKSRKQYVDTMNVRYGSLREGRKWVAYASPHETGLAVDFGNNGLTPKKAQISRMLREPAYRWLQQNAYKYGFSPYKNEPWHWEVQMPRDNWNSGDEFTSDLSVYVEEKSNETQRLTRNVIFAREAFA
jgi:D-alanyl-D-alanine dipeptidase